ncbi:MAG: acyl-ACP--UDP-N-acetylglucosamine O-acyltransferase [Kiritimatiellae bacterium]|nr:acyl-ACP--UDP-N-acetylglucosamine O-acyltransferase [Kiritimatiellia bacterium]
MTSIHPTAVIAEGARLGQGVEVGPYSVIGPNVSVGDRTRIMAHVFLDGCTRVGAECTVFPFSSIGTQTQDLKYAGGKTAVEIGDRTTLREYVTVNSGTAEGECTRVGSDCHIMAYSHVAHTCTIGDGVIMANGSQLAGEVVVERQAVLGGLVGVHQFCRIGRLAMIGHNSKVNQDVPPFMLADGNPLAVRGVNSVGMERKKVNAKARAALKNAHRFLYRMDLSTRQALEKIRAELEMLPEVEHLVRFIEESERGIVK